MTESNNLEPLEISGAVAVVTGGANGIGKGIVKALLEGGAAVVIADIEEPVLNATVAEFDDFGDVSGVPTDVSDFESVEACADAVYQMHGRCDVLFNNAGVGAGGGKKAWTHEPNDWRWCFGVNVFGMANGVTAFVPRMLESGRPGHVINTSSGDGGFAPVPLASVYAASKSAVSCFTESLHHQLLMEGTGMAASVFYPSGGLLDTGLFDAARNRPAELARVRDTEGRRSMTFEELKERIAASGRDIKVADLDELGRFVVESVKARRFIIGRDLDDTVELLHRRADAIGRFDVPPPHEMGI